MKVSELGEFGLIDLLAKLVNGAPGRHISRKDLIIGIGDDAACWRCDTSTQLATIDSFIQDIHFTIDDASWAELGWKALAVNLSDIAAMGGMPTYALVSLALPGHIEVQDVIELYGGMDELAQQFGVIIVGGDTTSAPVLAITIAVLGNTRNQDKQLLTRSGARPGDKIAVTGCLGTAAAGLKMLTEKLHLTAEVVACLRQAFFHPYPRVAEGQLLIDQGVKTAIDISDGLMADLSHICESSGVGALIKVDCLPIEPVVKASFGESCLELALSGGEDYELLFTGSTQTIDRIKTVASCPVTVIGEIVTDRIGRATPIDCHGNTINIKKAGWEHFPTG
jgi:thiamine-monophosphate kinase